MKCFSIYKGILLLNLVLLVASSCTPRLSKAEINLKPDIEPPVFVVFPNDVIDTCGNKYDYGMPVAKDNSGEIHLVF